MPGNARGRLLGEQAASNSNGPAKDLDADCTPAGIGRGGRMTAYDRILDALRDHGSRYREGTVQTMAQCPSHEDREASLAIYRKPGRIKIVCYAGCDDALDILPALGLTLPDLWDQPKTGERVREFQPDPVVKARIEARRNMTVLERALDDLLQLPDLGERLARCIALQGGDHE